MSDTPQLTGGQLEALRRIKKMERGIDSIIVKRADAAKCMGHGWAVKRGGGRYALTVEGRVLLQELGEVGPMSSSK